MKEQVKKAIRIRKTAKKIFRYLLMGGMIFLAGYLLRPYYPKISGYFKLYAKAPTLDTEEIDSYFDLLLKHALPGKELVLDLGLEDKDSLQLAIDRLKSVMGLKDYTIWLAYHDQDEPPAYIQQLNDTVMNLRFSKKITKRREQLNVLAHELSHVYVWKLKSSVFEKCDQEKLTDCSTVFSGLGVLTLNGLTDETIFSFDGYKTQKKLFGYLSPEQFGYLVARYCAEKGIPEDSVRPFLNSTGRKYFDIGCTYLKNSGRKIMRSAKPATGIYWCPKCSSPMRISLSGKIRNLDCSDCK